MKPILPLPKSADSNSNMPCAFSPAELIMTLGTDKFQGTLMDSLQSLCRADMCSAFIMPCADNLQYLLSSGDAAMPDDVAYDASTAYANGFWRRDSVFREVLTQDDGHRGAAVRRLPIAAIHDQDYRDFHLRNGVIERVSLYRQIAGSLIILSLYRRDRTGPFTRHDLGGIRSSGEVLLASVAKHRDLLAQPNAAALHPSSATMAQTFLDAGRGLSAREAQTCAMVTRGRSAKEIAREMDVSTTTIATYRRRAYRKLGAASRRDLEKIYELARLR